MNKINFTKMVAGGNDFAVIADSSQLKAHNFKILARKICDRKFGIGADGLLIIGKSPVADITMRIFNADGSEAEMCGNGSRCAALWVCAQRNKLKAALKIETKAGIIAAEVSKDNIKVKLTDPKGLKLDSPIKINNRPLKVNFINTGVPHVVVLVEGLEKIDVVNLGRQIRYHAKFKPAGTNVDFVEVLGDNAIAVRTYERGVEDETLACGTGSVASALIYAMRNICVYARINVHTKGKEILKVYFDRVACKFTNVWLEGEAKKVYTGVYNV